MNHLHVAADWGMAESIVDSNRFAEAGLIHDLGNLIQLAASAINIAARTPDGSAAAMLERAKTCLEQAGILVRQKLLQSRGCVSDTAKCCPAIAIADVAAMLETMSGPDLRLIVEADPDLPMLACDPIGLRRALLNLALNARDAMEGKGVARIEARYVRQHEQRDVAEFRVVDTGRGMTPSIVARAFDPLFTTKTDGLGGIGLPMVARFARASDASVSIESEPGLGTSVILRLPIGG